MNTGVIEDNQQENIILLDKLVCLLQEQLNVINRSDVTGKQSEILAGQTQTLVDEIAGKRLLDSEQFKTQRENIEKLYKNLSVAVMARKNETENHLNHIRKGKKTLGTYRNNI
ncbi:MAG: hypothetical protein JW787_14865 [Sedimentisphaerales bacterium]|nr:hypothetical protein [Sedimentisphaerales bacterium]